MSRSDDATTRPRTQPEPATVGFRGRLVIDPALCTLEGKCAAICPTSALQLQDDKQRRHATLTVDLGHCVFCGLCEEVCPPGAIELTPAVELASRTREALVSTLTWDAAARPKTAKTPPKASASTSASTTASTPSSPVDGWQPGPAEGGDLRRTILDRLGRSLRVRHVDAGSCSGCESELLSASRPLYDLARYGVVFVESPAEADVLAVTGTVTTAMSAPLRATWEAMPVPRRAIAIGACGIGGGVFRMAEDGTNGLEGIVPIDVYVPGCPPPPEAIVHAFLMLVGRPAAALTSPSWRGAYPSTEPV